MISKILKSILLLGIILFLHSCKATKVNSIVGTWKLSAKFIDENSYAVYSNSATQKIISERTVTFNPNGTFTSNGDICNRGIDILDSSSGKYNKYNNKDAYYVLQPDKCIGISGNNILVRVKNKQLYIEYPSIGYDYQIFDKQIKQ
ncbi:hypothetical protein [Chryseobacterium sp. MA9]|uniref:hypothetical protein n=1 Tax=Chryseobacterium sp. MA9 TaxID=2966625 RepID=UPI002103BB04|nr:hypothetical protein [Chryseobacterium sp. MA9]UTX47165.1 hypothetical protein KIK00_14540 [Chryseobacterium sp. MA9]